MLCQPARRASSGWADTVEAGVEVEDEFERSVSWIPGAEGAPLEEVGVGVVVVRFVVDVG